MAKRGNPVLHPTALIIGLDELEAMLRATAARLAPLGGRGELGQFRLAEPY